MIPFAAPVDDILFSMEDVAGAAKLPEWDSDLARDILTAFTAFAEGVIAPLNEPGDTEGCRLADGKVLMPEGFGDGFSQLAEMGWQGLTAPETHGGMQQGPLVAAMVSEVFSGANHSMQMVCNLVPGAISTLLKSGTGAQQAKWIPKLASGEALSTMGLTEPGAGSDLSRVRTKAVRAGDAWRLNGEKIFISGGDQDMSQDILHLVLARSGVPEDGVKGLSLFLTSKLAAGDTVKVTRIEEKLGLHASPTCQMAFDDAPAELVGAESEGLKAMFTLMNHARLDVALQGAAHAARAHAIAAAYAADRKQGRKADGSPAVLSDHADVRRMLGEQRSLAIGARAMAHVALVEMSKGESPALADFLTPLCKVFCTEAGIRAADLGIQILGGYGYMTEYGISQVWRDARITSIYEGANGIQEAALATRGLRDPSGADAFDALIGRLTSHLAVMAQRDTWRAARAAVAASDNPLELAHDFSRATTGLFYRAVWARIGDVSGDPELKNLSKAVLTPPPDWLARSA
ncbi:acyl-CoA dehydrogenase family protein [Leisingera sp. JC1]|uniref:acyl-CoA dehydrogenase family protein n=1 Tax=Leisingera sp. JC1 TaxID=1855282 RepID=UPI00080377F1|nr:acyl-CoA dehydrogenase family protein [Leisingera sp. JC1]OBY24907.1 acyl-CoA dehydrogenase [Leisingera sp. JC1]